MKLQIHFVLPYPICCNKINTLYANTKSQLSLSSFNSIHGRESIPSLLLSIFNLRKNTSPAPKISMPTLKSLYIQILSTLYLLGNPDAFLHSTVCLDCIGSNVRPTNSIPLLKEPNSPGWELLNEDKEVIMKFCVCAEIWKC